MTFFGIDFMYAMHSHKLLYVVFLANRAGKVVIMYEMLEFVGLTQIYAINCLLRKYTDLPYN